MLVTYSHCSCAFVRCESCHHIHQSMQSVRPARKYRPTQRHETISNIVAPSAWCWRDRSKGKTLTITKQGITYHEYTKFNICFYCACASLNLPKIFLGYYNVCILVRFARRKMWVLDDLVSGVFWFSTHRTRKKPRQLIYSFEMRTVWYSAHFTVRPHSMMELCQPQVTHRHRRRTRNVCAKA